ncbi:hypothetical protein QJQ45_010097 [Haematococcus lacustris]|nr:hypothetical protein QJQ45_010097 [Haematococcus lacustris]
MQRNRQRKRNRNASDIEVDRELEAQPEPSQAQKNKKASGESRRDRHDKNTWHAKKAKRHTVMRGVCAAGLEAGAVVASEVVELRVVTQLKAWVEACTMRALLGSLLLGLAVRGWFTRLRGLPDVQEVFEEIPEELAVIPNLADRNMYLQLIRGLPPPSRRSQPSAAGHPRHWLHPHGSRDNILLISARMKPPTGAMECSWPDECAASPNGLPGGWPPTCDVFLGFADTPSDCYKQPGPSAAPLKAMGSKKRAVKAKCANMQKAREVVAQRRAAEAAGPREVEAQAEAIAAEAEAQADAGADEADAQLHQLQADPQHSEQQLAHNQRMQHLQQQLQDLQRSELQRKEQQLADLEAQQRAALLQWEQQLIERQHQLEQQQADLSRREQDLTERQHQLQQQQADLDSREQQQARIQTLPQQLHSLQQELKAQQVAEVQRVASYCGPRIVQPNPGSAKQLSHWKQRTMSVFVACAHYKDMAGNYREESVFVSADKCDQSAEASTTALVQVIESVEDVLALYPGLHARLNAVPRYEHDCNTVDDVGTKLETNFANSLTELFLRRVEQAVALAGARVIAGSHEHLPAVAAHGGSPAWTERQRSWVARSVQGKVVTWLQGGGGGHDAWLERAVNRGSLLRHAVDTSRQLEAAHVSWQLDWADWQAAGGQRNTRPYRPPFPFALTPSCSCKAHHIKLDTRALFGLMRTAGMLPADITSLPKFRSGVAGPKDTVRPNVGQKFAQVVHTDGVAISVMFIRPKPAEPPGELPRMGKEEGAVNPLAHLDADWLGCAPGRPNMATVAHEERYPSGAVKSVWQRSLTAGQYYRQSGITEHAKESKVWMAGIKPQHDLLSQVTNYTASLQRTGTRWSNARFRLYGGKQRTVAKFWAETVKGAKVRCNSAATGRPLALAYGAAGFSGSGSIGSKGVPVKQMQREACKQFPGRVVLVHEFRTSRVSSARTNVVQGQAESFRWLYPVRSMAKRSRIRGLMCSTSNVIKRRFYDRDVSAALNIARIAAGPGRPRELSSWLGRPAMPNPHGPGVGASARQRPAAEVAAAAPAAAIVTCVSCHEPNKQTIRLPLTKGMCVR